MKENKKYSKEEVERCFWLILIVLIFIVIGIRSVSCPDSISEGFDPPIQGVLIPHPTELIE